MAKSLGPGFVYVIGVDEGPCKVGMSTKDPRYRLKGAMTDLRRRDLRLIRSWDHDRPAVVERFSHVYLQGIHLRGEWFQAEPALVIDAVERVISRMRPAGYGWSWFTRAGLGEAEARELFSTMPSAVQGATPEEVMQGFIRVYWRNQYLRPGRKPLPPWTNREGSENYFHARMGGAAQEGVKPDEDG